MDLVEGTNWTHGAAEAVRVAIDALREEAPDLRLTVDEIGDVLTAYAHEHPDELAELRDEVEGLKVALVSRATIEQAKGILMASNQCDPDEAFGLLVRASQRENVKLRDIAARIVDNASRPDRTDAARP